MNFYIPETGAPMVLAEYQKRLLQYIFPTGFDRLPFTTVLWSELKKSGKSAFAAAVCRWWAEAQEAYNELYCCANDFEQASGRNYAAIRTSIELAEKHGPKEIVENAQLWKLGRRRMTYGGNQSFIQALSGNYRGAAGGNPGMILFSELWGFLSEKSRRLYGEMTTVPTRKNSFRWVETYAGWEGESSLLEELYDLGVERGEPVPEFDDLRAPNGEPEVRIHRTARMLTFWSHTPRQSWQLGELGAAYYEEQRATLRSSEFRRFHKNEWTSREGGFVEAAAWDGLSHEAVPLKELLRTLAPGERVDLVLALDASKNRDSSALIGITVNDNPANRRVPFVDLCVVRIFEPALDPELGRVLVDLDETVGAELYELAENPKICIAAVVYDPYQLHSIMTTFAKRHPKIDVREVPQTEKRVETDTSLRDLILQRRLRTFFHPILREHVLNAVAIERPRGVRLDKDSTSKKIDGAVALAMATWAALYRGPRKKRKFLKV